MLIREAIIVMGYQNGIKVRELGETLGVDTGVSKRREAATRRAAGSEELTKLLEAVRSATS